MKEQKKVKNRLKQNKGITLITLVITIIVLLILAGVSINAITGNESVIDKAKQAKEQNEKASKLEQIQLAVISAMVNGTDGYVNGANLADALEGIVSSDQITEIRANTSGPWKITGEKGAYIIQSNGQVETKVTPNAITVGSTVNYSTTHNGKTLNTWKVFHVDLTNNKVWIILSDYLPYDAIGSISGLAQGNVASSGTSYCVKASNNRTQLLDAMGRANWTSLKTGTLNGVSVPEAKVLDAMGSPDLELWRDSWNANHEGDANDLFIDQNSTGYLVKKGSAPESSNYSATMEITGKLADLYFAHTSQYQGCAGFWLASPSAYNSRRVMIVDYCGDVNGDLYYSTNRAFRPVVCLSSDLFE